jgi:hypothetical protein
MRSNRNALIVLNLVGGIAVLGSYAWGIGGHPESRDALWGGVPDSLRPFYTVSMFSAALGYLLFSTFIVFGRPGGASVDGAAGGAARLPLLYGMVLIPSALWLPLTFEMVAAPSALLWWSIRAVLFSVGFGSLGLLLWLVRSARAHPSALAWAAVAGGVAFCIQTALLDALVWPAFFPVTS